MFGRDGVTMDEIIEATRQSNAYDFIQKLPKVNYGIDIDDAFTNSIQLHVLWSNNMKSIKINSLNVILTLSRVSSNTEDPILYQNSRGT